MRIVAKFEDADLASKFSAFLSQEGIANSLDFKFNLEAEKAEATLWVHNEDEREKAEQYYQDFIQNPLNPMFETSSQTFTEEKEEEKEEIPQISKKSRERKGVTVALILLCSIFYLISFLQSLQVLEGGKEEKSYIVTPIQLAFLYDIPKNLELAIGYLQDQGEGITSNIESLSNSQKVRLEQILQTPYWKGYYPFLFPKEKREKNLVSVPPFNKIVQGQVWRLFTPCLLHGGLLHILFNMLWLWFLGRQVERNLSFIRLASLIIVVGIVSNTAQYLMSGFSFVGFSGVIAGMAGFIWSRQKIAPWEEYLIPRSVFIFLSFYIVALFFYQLFGYFAHLFTGNAFFSVPIANTAHIVGALAGIFLGRLSFFSRRVSER